EVAQGVGAGGGQALGRLGVRTHQLERSVREVVQQVVARGEMPVERSDPYPGVVGDRGHADPEALAVHGSRCRPHERVPIERSVAALLTTTALLRTTHEFI